MQQKGMVATMYIKAENGVGLQSLLHLINVTKKIAAIIVLLKGSPRINFD